MGRTKIVFVIDTESLVIGDSEFANEDIVKEIRFGMLRVLTHFGGKHGVSGEKGNLAPLWGYKFFRSSGGHLEYGNHHFFDMKLKDFQRFEEELEEKALKRRAGDRCSTTGFIADQFSCALAEVVEGFQWERPDFLSPVKSNRRSVIEGKGPKLCETEISNFVFLFTPCPKCCEFGNYFPHGIPSSAVELQTALVKEEIGKKMKNDCKISFNWIDMGKRRGKITSEFHQTLSEMMKSFSGALIQLECLSFWWVERQGTGILRTIQPGSFGCFLDYILSQKSQPVNDTPDFKMSIDVFKFLLSLNDTCAIPGSPLLGVCIPVILRNAVIKTAQMKTNIQDRIVREPVTSNKKQRSFLDCQDEASSYTRANGTCKITGVFKSSAALSFLQNCKESYYCSYDFSELGEKYEEESYTLSIFSHLLRILKAKKLILVVSLRHPETGCHVNACLQPWTNLSGILTIMTSSFICGVTKRCLISESVKEQLALIQGLMKSIQARLDRMNHMEGKQPKDAEFMSQMKSQASSSVSSSFMQSTDYWFADLPSHYLPPKLHHHISRLQDLDTESYQRASRRSSALLKRLKDYYKEKKCNRGENIPEREASKTEVPTIDGRNLKTRSLSRSALLIENSKVVKKQRKSEDDMKSKNYTLTRSKSDGDVENGGESEKYRSIDDCDEDQDDDFCAMTLKDLASFMKNELLTVLAQDITSCEASAKRLSRNVVLCLNKLNENQDEKEAVSPDQFLERVFKEISLSDVGDKSAKVLRYILRVLMDLEIAVLEKRSGTVSMDAVKPVNNRMHSNLSQRRNVDRACSSDDAGDEAVDPVADKVLEQLRPLVFLEDPAFIAKLLNTSLLPRFGSKIPKILRDIYEGLGQQIPFEVQSPSQKNCDADDSFEVINDSVAFSDYGSNNASNQSGSGFRRFASVGDSISQKRQIVVPNRTKKNINNRTKMGYLSETAQGINSKKEIWCRNLFEAGQNSANVSPPPTGSRKRKLFRRYSELTTSVKDTPARKQKRHFFWKRQHKERRKTNGITEITVIEESPIKDDNVEQSPAKLSESSRFLSRSQSFSCKTSPRRFYAPKRSYATIEDFASLPRRTGFTRTVSCLSNLVESSHSNKEMDHRVDGTHGGCPTSKDVRESPIRVDGRLDAMLRSRIPEQDHEHIVTTPRKRSFSVGGGPLLTTEPAQNTSYLREKSHELRNKGLDCQRPKPQLNLLPVENPLGSFGFDAKMSNKPLLYSEDSMDWVAMFERDAQETEESPLPTIDSVSSFRGSDTDSLKEDSPFLSTPRQDGRQPFSSPFLSANSLETLEHAPILSPRLRGSKLNRDSSCRKRIEITADMLENNT